MSDNGRQFTSNEFKIFTTNNNIKHIFTAPGQPSTNGQAENFVKTLKKSVIANLKQNKQANMDQIISRFLIDYRNAKHCVTNETPAKLMLRRNVKTIFNHLKPPTTKENIEKKQEQNIKDRKGKRNVEFQKGEKVFIRNYTNPNKASWSHAIIKEKLGTRMYSCVYTHNSKEIRRHLDQIRNADNTNNTSQTDDGGNMEINTKLNPSTSSSTNINPTPPENNNTSPNVIELRPRCNGKFLKTTKR